MYNWNFVNVGGQSRVRIATVEDLQHIAELDQKFWTVLSCPTTGLEIPDEVLGLIDTNKDGTIRVNEVIAMVNRLLGEAEDAEVLIDEQKAIAQDAQIAELDAAIAGTAVETKAAPEAPYTADILAAYAANKEAYNAWFEAAKLEKLGLGKADPEAAPAIEEKKWDEMGAKIAAYEAETAAVKAENEAALAAATADLRTKRQSLLLQRWFHVLLRNYVTLEDFYEAGKLAAFQCGRLIIDQRECRLCVRVTNAAAMAAEAAQSGMYLLFCTCVNRTTGKTLDIVAAMTRGDVNDLFMGKNAIFYDRSGLDYDAKVTKIIDNPISIKQAFWSPYIKFGNWVKELINKSAAEKESKSFENMKVQASDATNKDDKDKQQQAFDIAKFAGIFAAIGMAMGFIGSFFVSLGTGISSVWNGGEGWWMLILIFVGLMLCISGPSMFLAWLKLRARNLTPILNANGWAINAKTIVNVPFGQTLTDEAKFPMVKKLKKGKK